MMNEPACRTCGGPHFTEHHNNSGPYNMTPRKVYTKADLDAARKEGRKQGMEAAAEIADDYKGECFCEGDDYIEPHITCGPCQERQAIADAIRAAIKER